MYFLIINNVHALFSIQNVLIHKHSKFKKAKISQNISERTLSISSGFLFTPPTFHVLYIKLWIMYTLNIISLYSLVSNLCINAVGKIINCFRNKLKHVIDKKHVFCSQCLCMQSYSRI